MSSNTPGGKPTHYVAPIEETPLVEIDSVKVRTDEKPSNLWRDAWRDLRGRPLF